MRNRHNILLWSAFVVACQATAEAATVSKPQPQLTMESEPGGFESDAGPLVTDLDFDGANELVIAGGGRVFIYRLDGTLLYGGSQWVGYGASYFAAVDVRDFHEIALDGGLLALLAGRSMPDKLPSWPLEDDVVDSAMVIVDLTGDVLNDYVYLDDWGEVHVRTRAAAEATGWPVDLYTLRDFDVKGDKTDVPDYTPFAVGNLDTDIAPEVILSGTYTDGVLCDDPNADYCEFAGVFVLQPDGSGTLHKYETNGTTVYLGAPTIGLIGSAKKAFVAFTEERTKADPDPDAEPGDKIDYVVGGIKDFSSSLSRGQAVVVEAWDDPLLEAAPVIADVNRNGDADALLVDYGIGLDADYQEYILANPPARLHALAGAGFSSDLPGWPINLLDTPSGPPVVGDIDGDGDQEVLIGTDDGVFAYHHDGETYRVVQGTVDTLSVAVSDPINAYKINRFPATPAGATDIAVYFDRVGGGGRL